MTEMKVRDRVLLLLNEMPDNATFEDILERLILLRTAEHGQRQIAADDGSARDEESAPGEAKQRKAR